VVIDAGGHRELMEPAIVNRAAWVLSHYQTMRVGELRLNLKEGRVLGGLDRKIDLDDTVAGDPVLAQMLLDAEAEVDAVQQKLYVMESVPR